MAVLLLGVIASFANKFTPEVHDVVIKYVLDGEEKPFKIYSETHKKGEHINIISPFRTEYKADKERVIGIVKSDLNVTVTYTRVPHIPDETCDVVLKYPTSYDVGLLQRKCTVCGEFYEEEFTTLTRKVIFGGDSAKFFNTKDRLYSESPESYVVQDNSFILLKTGCHEFDIIFDGIDFDKEKGFGEAGTVTLEYDESVWGEDTIMFKNGAAAAYKDFYIRFADNWRIYFKWAYYDPANYDNPGQTFEEWLLRDDCPLKTSPITITLTYDFTK